MAIMDPNGSTDSSDLGVRTDNAQHRSDQHWKNELVNAENDRDRAYAACEWIRACGDIVPVEGGELRACDEDGVWNNAGTQALREKLRSPLQERYTSSLREKTKEQLLAGGVTDRSAFGMPSGKVALNNGLLDLQTGEIRPIRPKDRVLWKLPTEYDPDAECPQFRRALREWLPNAESRKKVQEFVGYTLDFDNTEHDVMLMLIGPTRTGKSTFLNVIRALFGEDNITHMSIQYLANDKWGIAELEQTPINIRHDLDSSDIRNAGVVKELASGEPMKAERKNQDPYSVHPRTKHMFSANRVPECTHSDDAFYNRWLMIEFDQQVPGDQQDRKLCERLTTQRELSGVLNWAIEGYQRLQNQGRFTAECTPDETRALWQKNGGSIDRFIHQHVETERDAVTSKETMYTAYKKFAESHGTVPENKSKLTRNLRMIRGVETKQRRFDGERKWAYVGVKLAN